MKDKLHSTASPPVCLPHITGKTLAWAVVFGAYPFAGFLLSMSPQPENPMKVLLPIQAPFWRCVSKPRCQQCSSFQACDAASHYGHTWNPAV